MAKYEWKHLAKPSLECKKNLKGVAPYGRPPFFVVLWVRILEKYVKNSIFGQKKFWGWGAPYPPPPNIHRYEVVQSCDIICKVFTTTFTEFYDDV